MFSICRKIAGRRKREAALRIPVPPGTVVKRKRGGQLLGELLSPGAQGKHSKHFLLSLQLPYM